MRIDSMDASVIQFKNTNNATQNIVNTKKNSSQDKTLQANTNEKCENQKDSNFPTTEVINAIEKANKTIVGAQTQLEFSIHEGTKEIMVKVINTDTKEVVREIPAEKILDMVAKIWELAGIVVDERR